MVSELAKFVGWVVRDQAIRATLIVGAAMMVTPPVTGVTYNNNAPVVIRTEEKEYVVGN